MTKIVCFESKKHFFRIVRFGKIVCFSPKDRLLWLKRSSAFDPKIVCFQQDRLLSTLPDLPKSKLVNQKSRSRIDKSGIEIESRQSRIRKSFSMNDMKSFLIHEAKIERNLERTTVLDSRSPVPVIVSNQDSSLLKPMRSQQLLK